MAARSNPVVVELGSDGVKIRGSAADPPASALVEAAMDWIDDPVGLLDGRPVPTAVIWRELMAAAAGVRCSSLVIVHPGDWPLPRVRRVLTAAESVGAQAVAVAEGGWERSSTLAHRRGGPWTRAFFRRAVGVAGLVVFGGVVFSGALSGRHQPPTTPALVSLVENRVAVLIPAGWAVERRTAGPGSPRVRVGSPEDPHSAVNITWSRVAGTTLAAAAASLRRAAAAEPAGVFDFASGSGGSRPAVTYREIRPGRVVRWAVFIDGSTRIAVGCQSAPGRVMTVLAPCLQAVRSAREAAF